MAGSYAATHRRCTNVTDLASVDEYRAGVRGGHDVSQKEDDESDGGKQQ